MASAVAELAGCSPEEVLVCSTGVIGVPLPMEKIKDGIKKVFPLLSDTEEAGRDALEGMMTTDTIRKEALAETEISGVMVRIAGIAKGSGMIHPNMGTMLAYVATDCAISKRLLQKALSSCMETTFNMISVDQDTSTNDTCLALANGMAGNHPIEDEGEGYEAFREALRQVLTTLSIAIARDGEGASRLLEAVVVGAKTTGDARALAKGIVSSTLFKAALFGADANFGRVLCAMGYCGAEFDPDKASIEFAGGNGAVAPFLDGLPVPFDEAEAKRILSGPEVRVLARLGDGDGEAVAWGCDLTYDYVRINGDYRS
jgi:glutamate N-acetyltransferase/amino-acid N-acetyltransferase